jgi:hypothetical protein
VAGLVFGTSGPILPPVTTRTKLNLSVLVSAAMMSVNILAHPLGVTGGLKLTLNVGVFVPLTLNFIFLRRLQAEIARDIAAGILPASKVAAGQRLARRRLIVTWILMVPLVLSFPFWLPKLSGVRLGWRSDLLVSVSTLVFISLIFWVMIRRMRVTDRDGKNAG